MILGQTKGHHRTNVMADHIGVGVAQLCNQFRDVLGHRLLVVASNRLVRGSHSSQINRDHSMSLGQFGHDLVISPPRLRPPGEQDDWRTASPSHVMKVKTVDICRHVREPRQRLDQLLI